MDTTETPSPAPADSTDAVAAPAPAPAPVEAPAPAEAETPVVEATEHQPAFPAPALDQTPLVEAPAAPAPAPAPEVLFNADVAQLKVQANPAIIQRAVAAKTNYLHVTNQGQQMIVEGYAIPADAKPSDNVPTGGYWLLVNGNHVALTDAPKAISPLAFRSAAHCLF